jgi:hypothetical protein
MTFRAIKKEILPVSILLAFCLYLFREIVFGGHALYGLDFNAFYLGMKQFLYNELHDHGSIPYWNPYIFGGIPFWAHFESAIFYPLGFLFWFLPAAKAYGYTMFLHLFLAGLFMYALARSCGIGRPGSFLAAAVFACSGFVMALLYLGQLSPIQSYIWLPAIITFLNRSLRAPVPYGDAALAGLLWGVQILAGAPQDAFYTFLASMVFLLCSVGGCPGPMRERFTRLAAVAVIQFTVGAGLAAVQIIPAFEFINESVRSALDSYENVTLGSYPPEGIITAFLPRFFGEYTRNTYWVDNVPWSVPQQNLYLGILPLFMAYLISWRQSPHRRVLLYLAVLGVMGFVLALGKHTPLYQAAVLFPGFDRFRSPFRIIVLWVFAGSLLAGMGLNDLFSGRVRYSLKRLLPLFCLFLFILLMDLGLRANPALALKSFSPFFLDEAIPGRMDYAVSLICREFHRFALLTGLSILLIFLVVRRFIRKYVGIFLLAALLLLDLTLTNGTSVKVDDRFYAEIASIQRSLNNTLGRDKSVFRVGSFQSDLSPNTEMVLGYQTVGGFTALFLHRFYEYINRYSEGSLPRGWQYFAYGRHPHGRMMDLLNVKYELHHPSRQYSPREHCLPRAFVAPECLSRRKEDVLSSLTDTDFDPTRTVILELQDPCISAHTEDWPMSSGNSRAEVVSYRPDEIRVRVSSPRPGFLFLSEIYYPGWKAFVDRTPTRILRGNYLFRVIPIPAGEHDVDVIFQPFSIQAGTGITLFTLSCLSAWLLLSLWRRKNRSPTGTD